MYVHAWTCVYMLLICILTRCSEESNTNIVATNIKCTYTSHYTQLIYLDFFIIQMI